MKFRINISPLFLMLALMVFIMSSCVKDEVLAPDSNIELLLGDFDEKSGSDDGEPVDGITDDSDDEEDDEGDITDDSDDEEDDEEDITDDSDDEEDDEDDNITDDSDDEEDDDEESESAKSSITTTVSSRK